MNNSVNQYYCFNETGKAGFPTPEGLKSCQENSQFPILMLDSCICLEIVKFVDHKAKAKVDKAKLYHLADYISRNKPEIIPLLGLMELTHDPISMKFDIAKFMDFKNRIDFFQKIPIKYIHSLKFDYDKNYFIYKSPVLETNSLDGLKFLLYSTYCCLLKIREIGLKGLNKEKAKQNLEDYMEWILNDLNRIMGIEFFLAASIFGGSTDLRKMAWIDGKKVEIKKRLWGTAWDILHARLSCNNIKMSKHFGRNIQSTLITKDFKLFKLMSDVSLKIIFDDSIKGQGTNFLMGPSNFKHYDADYVNSLNEKMLNLLIDRFGQTKNQDINKLVGLVMDLEDRNEISEGD